MSTATQAEINFGREGSYSVWSNIEFTSCGIIAKICRSAKAHMTIFALRGIVRQTCLHIGACIDADGANVRAT